MEVKDVFGWHKIDEKGLLFVREKLASFESMTWSEILVKAKKQNHAVAISLICKEARKRLEETCMADVDELTSLHLAGKQRVWGILREGVLSLLWWDPEHIICPSLLKHT
jgi:hypothetical protein